MKKFFKIFILTLGFTGLLIANQSTHANQIKVDPGLISKWSKSVRIQHAAEVLMDDVPTEIASNHFSDHQINYFISTKVADSLPVSFSNKADLIASSIVLEANAHNMDPMFITALIAHESKFNPLVRGHYGEQGLMQIKPSTARWMAQKYHLDWNAQSNLYDPETNIKFGVTYLSYLRTKYQKAGHLYVSAYNMGPIHLGQLMKTGGRYSRYQIQVIAQYTSLYAELEQTYKSQPAQIHKSRLARLRARIKNWLAA